MNRMNRMKSIFVAAALAIVAWAPVQAASLVYDSYLDDTFKGQIATTDTFKCALVTSAYTENRVTHTKFSDITNEVTGTGYTSGGATVVPTFVKDTTNHRMVVTFPTLTWTTSTIAAGRKGVCYKSTGTASTSPLVFVDDFGADITTSAGTFTMNASTIYFNMP